MSDNAIAQSEPSREELLAKIAEYEKKLKVAGDIFRVGEKGGVSMYGLGRFPATYFAAQWEYIIETACGLTPQELRDIGVPMPIMDFMDSHRSELSTLDGKKSAKLQNTIVGQADKALKAVYDELRRSDKTSTVAELEAQARKVLANRFK